VSPDASFESLQGLFRKGLVALVVEGDKFLGLITRMDVINYLRRQLR
jgi:cystathionine beta-synthase